MIWKNRRSERETEPSVPTQGGAPALQLLARALAAAIAIFAAVFTPAFAPAAAFADLLPLPTTTITATKVLTAWPEFTGEEFYIGTAECTGLHSLGDTYVAGYWSNEAGAWVAGDGSEAQPNTEEPNGNIRFDWVFTDETGFFGPEGQTYSFESLTQCIDRRGAGTPGCWVENWPHEPDFRPGVYTHAEWYAIFEGVSNGVCTYTITAYITDGTHTWQWIGYQRTQGIIKVQFRTTSSLTLVKQSAKPHVTNGNSLYSLEGVQYGLYASVADAQADANRLHTYTVATDGTTDAASLTVSGATTYYVKELSAGTGYRLDPEVHSVTVHPLENATFTVADEPIMDPFAMRKTVAAAGAAGSTDVNLAGKVRWTVEFYPGAQYASVAAAQASGAPQYTWVITCVASGYAEVSDAYLVSGSPLLYDDGNVPGIPFGTVVCTETWVDPDGPVKLTDTSPRLIWMTATGPRWQEGSSTWTDDIKSGRIHVEKSLLDGSGNPASPAPVAGIQVQVVAAATGNVVETLTLDAAGCATSGALAWGTYNLIEVAESVPANMYTWCERQGVPEGTPFATVQVGATDGATVSAAFENELRTGTLTLLKVSADPTVGAGLSIASVAGATYGLYASAEDAEADANRLFTFAIAEDGTSNETPGLEFGTYYVKELSAPVAGGYLMSGTVTAVALDEAAETLTVADTPISGAFSVRKMDAETGAVPQGRATFAGMRVHVAYYPVFAASAADLEGLEPELAWDVETDESGVAVVGEALPAGTYTVRETAAPLGYLLTDTAEHLVVIDAEGVHGAEEGVLTLRDQAVKAAIRVEKTLLHAGSAQGSAQGDASVLAGIRIDVANADTGLVVDTIVLGADGTGTSMPLPIGTYELREVGESVPEGVQPYSWTAAGTTDDIVFASVDIMPDDHGATLTRTFADYASETPRVHKTDIDSGEGLAGAVITLYKVPDEFVTVADGIVTVDEAFNRADLSAWEKVADYTTDAEGYVGLSMVKFGLWAWVETAAPVPYLTEARTADIHATAPIIHEMLFDKDHESRAQSCADKKVSIAVYIKEQTIAVTSAALDAEVAADFRDANNVGTETQWYLISAQNASSVDTEHFTIHMDFDDIRAHGGRVITVTTPVTSGDEDGEGVLSYATVDAPGVWVEWAHISATEPARFSVADLGGVELAGITLDYGWVAKDFTVGPGYNPENGEDLAFEIVYTEALSPADDVVIVHAVDVYTDLAVTAETTIWAVDDDGVRTVVIEPSPKRASGGPGGLPHTGDGANGALAGGIAAAALAALAVSAGALRRGRKGGKR